MTRNELIGVWQLESFVVEVGGERIQPFGGRPVGRLHLSADGQLLVTILAQDRPRMASEDPQACSHDEALRAVRSAAGYFGRWTFDPRAQTLTTDVEGSLFPNWEGTRQVRVARLDEDGRLRLTTPPLAWEGEQRQATLTWTPWPKPPDRPSVRSE